MTILTVVDHALLREGIAALIPTQSERTMLDHMILTVSDVERSLAFYEAALKPLNIKFFMPYKGKDGHPDLWGFGDGKRRSSG